MSKLIANEIFGIFEKYQKGETTYDKALEDTSNIIIQTSKYFDKKFDSRKEMLENELVKFQKLEQKDSIEFVKGALSNMRYFKAIFKDSSPGSVKSSY
jgi:mevalonate pyrophosphate decarboxylase